MLTKEQASDIFEHIKNISSADEVEVLFSGGRFALTRFANNTIHQNVAEENHVVSVRTVFGSKTARAFTNKFDDESLRQVVRASESLARVQHPDPDLLPLELSPSLIADLQKSLPELPDEKKARFVRDYALSAYDAGVLVAERETAEYFEAMVAAGADAKAAANWLINEYFGRLNKEGLTVATSPLSAQANAAILQMVAQQVISGKVAKDLLTIVWTEGGDPREIVERRGLKQVSDVSALDKLIDEIVANNPDKVADAKANPKAIGWFVGQVMKASGGKANPQTVNELLRKRIGA